MNSLLEALIAAKLSGSGGGGGSVTVDAALSATSENPVQNKAIAAALDGKGTYSKPSGGIPKSDLASAVQTSLGKADTALQAAPVTSVNGKTGAVLLTAADVGAAEAETVVTVSGTTPTITPANNTIYNCGEVESLTISNPPATGKYSIIFFSGATATTTVGIENFAAEANKRYKITVEDNYATYDSWPYTPT